MLTLLALENKIKQSWSLETCAPAFRKNWNRHNTSTGQCAITALVVNVYFGGNIKKCYVYDSPHYFNLINEKVVDLTKAQFGKAPKIDYANSTSKTREDILSNPDTKLRYGLLLESLRSK